MNTEISAGNDRNRARIIVIAYPFAILIIGIVLNLLVFEVNPFIAAFPSVELVAALIIATLLLLVNHTWLMTATELTRARFKMHSTPEEWEASGLNAEDASPIGIRELKRHHDTHLNTTENIVYFMPLAVLFIFASPPPISAYIWIVGFAIARMGYSYSFLFGKDNARGLFMTLSLLPTFGMATYLAMSLVV